ncbi:helicase associated domain-containing protein [Streptomyces umbrinus]|uniref:helicase associated domain-containing protein n=1 Tax=Streptomyces umbrinus TaxID=67370 RepID=UPI0033F12283
MAARAGRPRVHSPHPHRPRRRRLSAARLWDVTRTICRSQQPRCRGQASPSPPGAFAVERVFQRGLAAAQAFREREGHLNVPQRHIEILGGVPERLGQWLSSLSCRSARPP